MTPFLLNKNGVFYNSAYPCFMGFYKTRTISLQLSPSATKERIQELHKHLCGRHVKTKIDWITWDCFRFETNALTPLISYKGRIQNIDHLQVDLHIQPKLHKWRLLTHLIILIPTMIGLMLITFLMIDLHLIGSAALALVNGFILYHLYKNLIGRPKRQIERIIQQLSIKDVDYKP